ncbi:hypothetical protein GF359_05050 [candidate division WOR-3 bacterium]|uniref:Uncharacterized protein n=1 Tax=candidate division WOR-3 bacterium TaxID=2052148 RepID=A0A9D5K8T2_UNCW3|nr:hypothetical protein [candidate division WOR-3 bacterium]MBD3364563.1 hypothetical protein [candidate division WOR-3 bacterium]
MSSELEGILNAAGKNLAGRMAGEMIFNTHRSGTLYTVTTYLLLESEDDAEMRLPIPFPCNITVSGRSKIIITEVDGLIDTVKEDMGFSGYDLGISFEAGDYSISLGGVTIPMLYIPAHLLVATVAELIKDHKGPVKITEGAGFNFEKLSQEGLSSVSNQIGTASRALQVLGGQAPMFDPKPSLLNALGIQKVVFQDFSINPIENRRYQVSLSCVAEMDDGEEDSLFTKSSGG